MEFCAALIVVDDMEISKAFYQTLLGQKIKFDFGENVLFESGISLQLKSHFAQTTGISEKSMLHSSHNFELYFEESDFEGFIGRLSGLSNIRYVQPLVEHSWGQRVTRFYDPDRHIIEVGESMKSVVKRFLDRGMTPEETAEKTQHPIEFVKSCI